MACWLTVYCTTPVSQITGAQLLDRIRDRDDDAPAGVDYHTLAEDYDVDDALVAPALWVVAIHVG